MYLTHLRHTNMSIKSLHFLDHDRGPLAWAKVRKLFVVLSIYKTTISIDWYIWNTFLSRQGIQSVVGRQ